MVAVSVAASSEVRASSAPKPTHAMNSARERTRTVDMVVYPGFKALEAIGPMSVFEYANLHLKRRGQPDGYDVRIASTHIGAVKSDTLMSLDASKSLSTLTLPDYVIIVGTRNIQDALSSACAIVDWVAQVWPRIDRLAALCSGAIFLAAAGALDGKRATTHWGVAARLQADFPSISVDADAIFIRAENI